MFHNFSYGYNYANLGKHEHGDGWFRKTRLSEITYPSHMGVVCDSNGDANHDALFANPWWPPGQEYMMPGSRHTGGANVLFADWHVEWMHFETICADYHTYNVYFSIGRHW